MTAKCGSGIQDFHESLVNNYSRRAKLLANCITRIIPITVRHDARYAVDMHDLYTRLSQGESCTLRPMNAVTAFTVEVDVQNSSIDRIAEPDAKLRDKRIGAQTFPRSVRIR